MWTFLFSLMAVLGTALQNPRYLISPPICRARCTPDDCSRSMSPAKQDHEAEMGPDCLASDNRTRHRSQPVVPLTSTNVRGQHRPASFDRSLS
jgi:hypothetical protein